MRKKFKKNRNEKELAEKKSYQLISGSKKKEPIVKKTLDSGTELWFNPLTPAGEILGRKANTMFSMMIIDITEKTTGTVVTGTAVVGITERNKGNEKDTRDISTCRMC